VVLDRDPSGAARRVLVSDVCVLGGAAQHGTPLGHRLKLLQRDVLGARKQPGAALPQPETLHPRMKDYFPLGRAESLCGSFASSLPHGFAGIAFVAESARGSVPAPLLVWTPPRARFFVGADGALQSAADQGPVPAPGPLAGGLPGDARGQVVECEWRDAAWRYERTCEAGSAAPTPVAVAAWVASADYVSRDAMVAMLRTATRHPLYAAAPAAAPRIG
jgi:hypothetical protein